MLNRNEITDRLTDPRLHAANKRVWVTLVGGHLGGHTGRLLASGDDRIGYASGTQHNLQRLSGINTPNGFDLQFL